MQQQFTPKARRLVRERDNSTCFYCKRVLPLDEKGHTAHIIPANRGGPSIPQNAVFSCIPCNIKAHTYIHAKFMYEAFEYLELKGVDISWKDNPRFFPLIKKGDTQV